MIKNILWKMHQCGPISVLFHTLTYLLRRELSDYQSVLDLGCGPNSLIKWVKLDHKVGVEVSEVGKNNIYHKLIKKDIKKVSFGKNCFDAVILLDVIEHLSKDEAKKLLTKVEKWASKKIIIFTPNGFLPQKEPDKPYQTHLSGWEIDEMRKMGYKVYGMGGFKTLWQVTSWGQGSKQKISAQIRFRPKVFWRIIVELSQIISYYWPTKAFAILAVKKLSK